MVKIGEKGQFVIPKQAREILNNKNIKTPHKHLIFKYLCSVSFCKYDMILLPHQILLDFKRF